MKHSLFSQRLTGKLLLKEYILPATPAFSPFIFDPVGTTKEAILTRNVDDRVMGFPSRAIAKTLVTSEKETGYTLRWITLPVLPRGG